MRNRLVCAALLLVMSGGCGGEDGEATTGVTSPGTTTTATTVTAPASSTSTAATSSSTAPATTTTAPPALWMRVAHDEAVFGGPGDQGLEGVAAWGSGFVAVGSDAAGGDEDAAVWLSPDGLNWTRVPHDEAVFGGPGDQSMTSVVAGGPGLVAVGADTTGFTEGDAAVWTSADGITWARHGPQDPALGGPGYQGMQDVAAAGPGLVAVGDDGSGGDRDAAAWVSEDGLAWSRVPHDEARFGGPYEQGMFAVMAGGPGVVAVGWDSGIIPPVAAVWLSTDGSEWARVTPGAAAFAGVLGQVMWGVVPAGPGLVSVGAGGGDGSDAAVWVSAEGATWERVPEDASVFGGVEGQGIWGVAVVGGELIGVGSDYSGGDGDAVVWVSADGVAWSRAPEGAAVFGGPGDQILASVAGGEPGVVAVGYDVTGGDSAAAVWLRPAG